MGSTSWCDKQSHVTKIVDVWRRSQAPRLSIMMNSRSTRFGSSFVLCSVFENSVLASYLVRSPRFVPGPRLIPGLQYESGVRNPQSSFYTTGEPTQCVCVTDRYFIVNVLDIPFASPTAFQSMLNKR